MMGQQIRVVKKRTDNESKRHSTSAEKKTSRQRDREIVAVIKSWIEEFEVRQLSRAGLEPGPAR